MGFRDPGLKNLLDLVATRSCPQGNSCSIPAFMDVHVFLCFSEDFMGVRGPGLKNLLDPVATRSCPYRNSCSIPVGCGFMDFHGFSCCLIVFGGFHGFQGSGVEKPIGPCGDEVLSLKKQLLDLSLGSKETFARLASWQRFHEISSISSVRARRPGGPVRYRRFV
jgi:hypothetical protein